jgi:hypothetical protein
MHSVWLAPGNIRKEPVCLKVKKLVILSIAFLMALLHIAAQQHSVI